MVSQFMQNFLCLVLFCWVVIGGMVLVAENLPDAPVTVASNGLEMEVMTCLGK